MELYDTNHDGSLSDTELVACPGIHAPLQFYDTDGNGAVSREEIEEQLNQLLLHESE